MERTDSNSQLTLPEELYLLACDMETEKLTKRDVMGNVLRAAVLVELTARGGLTDDGGTARPVGDRRTGDPLLDAALRGIAEDKPRKWKAQVQLQRKHHFKTVEEQLERARLIAIERRTWRYDRIVVKDQALVKRLQAEVGETLTSGRPVKDYSTRQAALAALAAAGQFPTVISGKDQRKYKERIKALTERAGEAGPALKKALNDMQVATMIAVGAAISAGSS